MVRIALRERKILMGFTVTREGGTKDFEFEPYARTLRHPVIADLLTRAEPLTDVAITHSTVNLRHYYERLKSWPEGLVALGDSVAAFNPVYGHGMSVAALGAVALRTQLTSLGLTNGLSRRAQRAAAPRMTTRPPFMRKRPRKSHNSGFRGNVDR